MKKALVAYFSASGVTQRLAKTVAEAAGADLFEIEPVQKYTSEDLYDTVFVGFPIWWYEAPRIIHTFLEEYDFTCKTIVPFATSGGSGMGKTSEILQKVCPAANVLAGRKMNASVSEAQVKKWMEEMGL